MYKVVSYKLIALPPALVTSSKEESQHDDPGNAASVMTTPVNQDKNQSFYSVVRPEILAGIAASGLNGLLMLPLDVQVTRLMINRPFLLKSWTFGAGFTVVSTMAKRMVFPFFDGVKEAVERSGYNGVTRDIIAGGISGFGLGIVSTPISQIKVRLYEPEMRSSWLNITQSIIRESGIPGLFRGGVPKTLQDIAWCSLYFPAYAQIDAYLYRRYPQMPLMERTLAASGGSGFFSTLLLYPLAAARTKMQSATGRHYTIWNALVEVCRPTVNNIKAAGLGAGRTTLSVMTMQTTYEVLLPFFKKKE